MPSYAEENYLKAIYKLYERSKNLVTTNELAEELSTTPASVTDMIKRLAQKRHINYTKYKGARLTQQGRKMATNLIRKHRLWETFLVEKLEFSWDEVHEIAEELEHIESPKLIEKLDAYLNHPKYDPHGDPIPSADGKFTLRKQIDLHKMEEGEKGLVIGVKNHNDEFLRHLDSLGINLGTDVSILEINGYDRSMKVMIDGGEPILITEKVARNLFLKKTE